MNNTNKPENIIFLDTTLRDGQQCPGAGIEKDNDYFEYLALARETGFDIIEAGFPSASEKEFNRVNIASQLNSDLDSPIIAGLCQLRQAQIERTIISLEPGINNQKSLLHTYFPVDPNLLKASIGENISKNEILKQVNGFIKMAVDSGMIVQFSPEGYSRVGENFDFCTELIISALEGGASFINCPDTIGGASRFQGNDYFVKKMIKHKKIIDKRFPGNNVIWSLHNHNDYGLAIDNSIEGVVKGIARKIEGTVGGVGERGGNADLLQVVMQMRDFLGHKFDISHIDTSSFLEIGKFVSDKVLKVQSHYPIIGANAFRHTSGGHTNAVLKNPTVYQPFHPEVVGGKINLVFGPLSGGALAKDIIEKSGYVCNKSESAEICQYIKDYWVNRYKGITDEELLEAYFSYRSPISIDKYDKIGNTITFYGKIFDKENIVLNGKTIFQAIKDYIEQNNSQFVVIEFKANSDESGEKSDSISNVKIEVEGQIFEGTGKDNDIEMSSIKALINAYNKYYVEKNFKI